MISMNESKIDKRVHLPVYSTCLVLIITMAAGIMTFTGRLCEGFKKKKKQKKKQKNLKSHDTIIQKRKSRSVVGYINGVTQFVS